MPTFSIISLGKVFLISDLRVLYKCLRLVGLEGRNTRDHVSLQS
jgi:hypothetical protein